MWQELTELRIVSDEKRPAGGTQRMLSVIIATLDSERVLVPALAALVPGATAGLVSEVLMADGGSRDDTAEVADIAGCNFMIGRGPAGTAAQGGRGCGARALAVVPAAGRHPRSVVGCRGRAFRGTTAVARPRRRVRRGAPVQPALREALSLLTTALGARPRPEQGLLISHRFYDALGGHSERGGDSETDLLRRIGRRRIVTLSSVASADRYLT